MKDLIFELVFLTVVWCFGFATAIWLREDHTSPQPETVEIIKYDPCECSHDDCVAEIERLQDINTDQAELAKNLIEDSELDQERSQFHSFLKREKMAYETRVGATLEQEEQMLSWLRSNDGDPAMLKEEFEKFLRLEVFSEDQYAAYQSYGKDREESKNAVKAIAVLGDLQCIIPLNEDEKDQIYYEAYKAPVEELESRIKEILSEDQYDLWTQYKNL